MRRIYDIPMDTDFDSDWIAPNSYNKTAPGGWRLQIAWDAYATSGTNARMKIFGTLAKDDEPKVLVQELEIQAADNAADNNYIAIDANLFSRVRIEYTSNDTTAGAMGINVLRVG